MRTFKIHITGQVQGVGFRPFVYRLANEWDLFGVVINDVTGVHITINSDQEVAELFLKKIVESAPEQSRIENTRIEKCQPKSYEEFSIGMSSSSGAKEVRLSPDFGFCKDCMEDLKNKKDRRFHYAFTTCTNCGPRYSIIKDLPYDRPLTEMNSFEMCKECQSEYSNPTDRRFFSQTNSCPSCAVQLELFEKGKTIKLDQDQMIMRCIQALKEGQIISVKGIGGFLLLCDAKNDESVKFLRKRKNRPHKPLAVMYSDIEKIRKVYYLSDQENHWLTSTQSPILLLDPKGEKQLSNEITPNLDRIGVMLPYAPLLYLISQGFDGPLVATSGNVSGSPIIYNNKSALKELSRFSDLILCHNRNITAPQDDSVMCIPKNSDSILLRRSRGFAPSYFGNIPKDLPENWLALGAHMKGSFSISANNQIYISQYLGNLDCFDAQKEFVRTFNHLSKVLEFEPSKIFTDLHTGYFSNLLASEISSEMEIPVEHVQHHKAHFAAVLQENDLVESQEPVLGIIWDGTGLGEDQQIWGGEFFKYENYEMERSLHLSEFPVIMGDKMSLEPRLSALSLSYGFDKANEIMRSKFSEQEWSLYTKMLNNYQGVMTTSMGRLFDGVASLLGLIDKSSFEGQAAMYLEALARKSNSTKSISYPTQILDKSIDHHPIISGIISDLHNGVPKEEIAFRFHLTLVEMIRKAAEKLEIKKLAFSGGVFQNSLLVELINKHLSEQYELYLHRELTSNDENISFGQLISGYMDIKKEQTKNEQLVQMEA